MQRLKLSLEQSLFRCTQLDVVARGEVGGCNEMTRKRSHAAGW
jgi:hypothetical protein